jgi:hypothetical protein
MSYKVIAMEAEHRAAPQTQAAAKPPPSLMEQWESFQTLEAQAVRKAPSARTPSQVFVKLLAAQEAAFAGVAPEAVLGRSLTTPIARARQHVYARLRPYGYSLPGIGMRVGTDHTTVLHGIRRIAALEAARAARLADAYTISEDSMRRVIVETPFSAGPGEIDNSYLARCLRDCLSRAEAPIAAQFLYAQPGVLDGGDAQERGLGASANAAWGCVADATIAYVDHGLSKAMERGLAQARADNRPVEFRRLDRAPLADMWSE